MSYRTSQILAQSEQHALHVAVETWEVVALFKF
jgi:hypothetical protein